MNMNRRLIKFEIRKLLTDKKFVFVFLSFYFFFLCDTVEKIFYFSSYGKLKSVDFPAASFFQLEIDLRILMLYYFIFGFFAAPLIYADNYSNEKIDSGVFIPTVHRSGRKIISIKAALVFFSAFFVNLIPNLLSQVSYLFIAPSRSPGYCGRLTLYNRHAFLGTENFNFKSLYEFSPYLANAFTAVRVALFFAVYALFVYSMLLFTNRKSWVVILAAGIITFSLEYILGTLGFHDLIITNYFFTKANDGASHPVYYFAIVTAMLAASLIMIYCKIRIKKDEV